MQTNATESNWSLFYNKASSPFSAQKPVSPEGFAIKCSESRLAIGVSRESPRRELVLIEIVIDDDTIKTVFPIARPSLAGARVSKGYWTRWSVPRRP